MSEGENKGTAGDAAAAKARELQAAIKKLDFRDRVIFLGSAALVILFFLPWYSSPMGSASGLAGASWVGFIGAALGTVAGLANMGFIPLSGEQKALAGKTTVQLGLATVALLLGPIYYWSSVNDVPMLSAGKTFFFWVALLCALGAAGAAAWKLADERKGSPPPPAQ